METAYRLFMYIFPYAICLALYGWMFRKALKVPHKGARIGALAIILAGFCYTAYEIATTIGASLTDDNFHFPILIITTIVLFLAAIVMAFGEPEK